MLRALKLKRAGWRNWESADGRWLFAKFYSCGMWVVHERCQEDGKWHEDPATYDKFPSLWEAVAWASDQQKQDGPEGRG